MNKKHVYFVPGLAACGKIFKNISLPEEMYETHIIEWLIPNSTHEPLEEYTKRMCNEVKHTKPILVGVSFGGIMVQEMSKYLDVDKVIIISSIKTKHELPKQLQIAKATKAYKLFPSNFAEKFDTYSKFFIGHFLEKKAKLYDEYLSVRNSTYLDWAIYNVLHWQQDEPLKNVIHIHGTDDGVFPYKYINNAIEIEQGTHEMILNKAKKISKILTEVTV